jgi:hypothetical protein
MRHGTREIHELVIPRSGVRFLPGALFCRGRSALSPDTGNGSEPALGSELSPFGSLGAAGAAVGSANAHVVQTCGDEQGDDAG